MVLGGWFVSGLACVVIVNAAAAADLNQDMRFEDAFTPANHSPSSFILSGWGGYAFIETEDNDWDRGEAFTWGGDARGYWESDPGRGLQIEGSVLHIGNTDTPGGDAQATLDVKAGIHVIRRQEDYVHGVFGAVSYTTHADRDGNDSIHVLAGIEGSVFRNMTQYFGQIGGQVAVRGNTDETWNAGLFGTVGARHFFKEASALLAQASLGGLGQWEDGESPIWTQWILEYEHQLGGSGLSGFIAYQGDLLVELEGKSSDDTLLSNTVRIGLRLSAGGPQTPYALAKYGAGTFSLLDTHAPFGYTDDLY
jgi:hypothetical protein